MKDSRSADGMHELKRELRVITAPFRAGRLIILVLAGLFASIFALGFLEQILKGPTH